MAVFHPRTFELLREALDSETKQNAFDTARLGSRLRASQSLMAQKLRERTEAFPFVQVDLEWLLDFMQRLDDQANRHEAERAAVEQDAATALGVESGEPR